MTNTLISLPTLEALSTFIKDVLCEQDALDPLTTPFFRSPMVRNGRPWGYIFHVEGPRLLKSSAIWAAEADIVTFYDSTGIKTSETRLTDAPVLPDIRLADPTVRSSRRKRKSA
jgi:hypothetical protein